MLILYEMLHMCSVMHTRCKFENTKHRCLGIFFTNLTLTAVAEISIRGDFFFKSYHKFIEFNLFFIDLNLFWIDELIHLYSIYLSSMNIESIYDMKITDDIFKSISNESVWISITISLKFIPKGPIDYKSVLVQVMAWQRTGEKPLPESMLTKFTEAYMVLGGNEITKLGRSFHWGLVHLVQSASLRWNSPKIFHTVFETLPVDATSLSILSSGYWHPPQSNFTEYKHNGAAVFYAPVDGQWVN